MNGADFIVALNRQTPILDRKVLKWAWSERLFDSFSEFDQCRIQKINWFAGYLFPKEEEGRLEYIMQFFLQLFLLDDLQDSYPKNDMIAFTSALIQNKVQKGNARIHNLGRNLLKFRNLFKDEIQSSIYKKKWEACWEDYLEGILWELTNKANGKIPSLNDYRLIRPLASGVFMAIFFLRKDKFPDSCDAEILEWQIARFICLANDLASFKKEKEIGDHHNEILLLQDLFGVDPLPWANKELKALQKKIISLSNLIGAKSQECKLWVEDLNLLIGGCLYWSSETVRYSSYINGNPRKD